MQAAACDDLVEVLARQMVREPDRPVGIGIDRGEQHPEHRQQEQAADRNERNVGGRSPWGNPAVLDLDQIGGGKRLAGNRGGAGTHICALAARTNRSEKPAPIRTSTSAIAVP